jgi:hypothetical protein
MGTAPIHYNQADVSGPAPRTAGSLGRWIRLRLEPAGKLIALGPAWAVLCGAIASGRLGGDGRDLLALLLALLLAEPLLGGLWRVVVASPWEAWAAASPSSDQRLALPPLPYTAPGSPSARLTAWLSAWLARLGTASGAQLAQAVGEMVGLVILALAVAIVLGWQIVALLLVALAIAVVQAIGQRRGWWVTTVWPAIFDLGLAWLIGEGVFRELSLPGSGASLAVAGLYTIAYAGGLALTRGDVRRGLAVFAGAQGLVVALLIALQRPLHAGAVGLLLVPALLLATWLKRTSDGGAWLLQRTQLFWLLGMLVAALAIR